LKTVTAETFYGDCGTQAKHLKFSISVTFAQRYFLALEAASDEKKNYSQKGQVLKRS
jgi:hypothetical protein